MFTNMSLRGVFSWPKQTYFTFIPAKAGIHFFILLVFLANTLGPSPMAQAEDFRLPAPGVMVQLSPAFNPPNLKGIKVHPDNPFRFDFILDKGDSQLSHDQLKDESNKLIKYFLASLTISEKDLWVNLSPYEKDRIVPESFGQTEMGRDLLAEDYMLKQITASLIYPEGETGKKFWKRIYEEAAKKFGTTNIPVNTFNKVWIVPGKAVVYENANAGTAYVVESKLGVMLEQDYLSLQMHEGILSGPVPAKDANQLGSKIVREIVIPELTREVNFDRNFSQLRQVYNSLILATWYKKKIKDSILTQVYENKNKIAGVNIDDPQEKQKIYQRYLQAFKRGAYNYIKEEIDPFTQETIPRKYFSGGVDYAMFGDKTDEALRITQDSAMIRSLRNIMAGTLLILGVSLAVSPQHAIAKDLGAQTITEKNQSFDPVQDQRISSEEVNRLIDQIYKMDFFSPKINDTDKKIYIQSSNKLLTGGKAAYNFSLERIVRDGSKQNKSTMVPPIDRVLVLLFALDSQKAETDLRAVLENQSLSEPYKEKIRIYVDNVRDQRNWDRLGWWIFVGLFAVVGVFSATVVTLGNRDYNRNFNSLLEEMERKTQLGQSIEEEIIESINLMESQNTAGFKKSPIDYGRYLERLAKMVLFVGNKNKAFSKLRQELISVGAHGYRLGLFPDSKPIKYISDETLVPLAEAEYRLNGNPDEELIFDIFDRGIKKGILSPEGHSIFNRYRQLKAAGIAPLKCLIDETQYGKYTVQELTERAQQIRQGEIKGIHDGLDIHNELDVALNYSNFMADSHYLRVDERITFKEFKSMFQEVRKGHIPTNPAREKIPEAEKQQIRGLVYEAYLMWTKILDIQKRAEDLGRPVVVVENLSYGAVALAPITTQHMGQKYIVGTMIPVISTKIGSTENHRNEYYLRQDLFTETQIKDFMGQEPIIIVVDGTTSVADPTRTLAHIPDAYKGYRNWFLAFNLAVAGRINPEGFYEDQRFADGLRSQSDFKIFVNELRSAVPVGLARNPYQLKFWYPGNKGLDLRENKVRKTSVPKLEGMENINGPTVIFMQSAMEPEAVKPDIKKNFIKGKYTPGYYDDRNHYKRFYMTYREGFGFVYSSQYADFSREVFLDFLETHAGSSVPIETTPAAINSRPVDVVALDLDGSIAKLGENLSRQIIDSLIALIKNKKKLVILTDDIEASVDRRLADFLNELPVKLKRNVTIFSDSAGQGYTFDENGEKSYLDAYNLASSFKPTMQTAIRDLVISNFSRQLSFETRENRLSPFRFGLLVNQGLKRSRVFRELQQALPAGVKAYITGSRGIRIVLQHKENALDSFLKQESIAAERVLIMADMAKTDQIDRELLARFPDAICVNLGRYAHSILQRNPSLIQMNKGNRGVQGAQAILEMLVKRNSIPTGFEQRGGMVNKERSREKEDAAMFSIKQVKGGIDLSSDKALTVQNNGQDIKFHIDSTMLKRLQSAPGFVPVIINFQPMIDIRGWLGLNDQKVDIPKMAAL